MRACPRCLSVYSVDAEHCSVDGEKLAGPQGLRGKSIQGYVFDDLLGVGGTGCVYRGHTKRGEPCAIKLLFREMANDESLMERFRREAEAVSEMDHPNVVRIFGWGSTPGGTAFIAMEYLEGKTLKDILEADAPLQHVRAGRIAEQLASALGEAHRLGFVHRDLKPGNIMICRDAFGREQVKLLDFGIVASLKEREADQRLTKTGYIVGTPTYMAPEQIDPKQVGPQVDVYALGVMLYEMLSGQPPFRGTLEQILVAKMTEDPTPIEDGGELGELALRFLEKDPAKRPKNALQASAALSKLSLLSDDPATVRADIPDLPTFEEVGAAPPTVRFTEWDMEVTKPPRPRDRWTADTRRINFENEAQPGFRPVIASSDETPDLIAVARPDTLIDGPPSALTTSSASIISLPSEPTDAEVELPTEIRSPDSLFRDTDEDMPVPEVSEAPEEPPPPPEDLLDDRRHEDEPTVGEEDTALQLRIDEPPIPTTRAAPPPVVPRESAFALGRAVALAVLVLTLAVIAGAIAFDIFSVETVIIDVPTGD